MLAAQVNYYLSEVTTSSARSMSIMFWHYLYELVTQVYFYLNKVIIKSV